MRAKALVCILLLVLGRDVIAGAADYWVQEVAKKYPSHKKVQKIHPMWGSNPRPQD